MDLNERYGDDIGNWLQDVAVYEMAKYDCADNLRVAEKSNKAEMEQYMIAEKRGCCGSYCDEFSYKGRQFLIGFNYGH